MNLKCKGVQQSAPKTFSNLYTFLAVYSARYVKSQIDMNDSHFLPLDIASCSTTFIITNVSVLFL